MAHRGRGGRFVKGSKRKSRRSVPRGGGVTVVRVSGGNSKRRGRAGRFRGGVRRASDALAKENGPLIGLAAAAGWLDSALVKFGLNPVATDASLQAQAGRLIAKIPRIGPFGWKAIVGGIAYVVHRGNRRNRWAGRVATTMFVIEGYGFGYAQGNGPGTNTALLGNGQAGGGGFIPAG
jgi:hypothetical protein